MLRTWLFSSEPRFSILWALVRVVTGLLIVRHGTSVLAADEMRQMGEWLGNDLHLPAPLLMAYLAKGSEFFGGMLLALGLLTRPATVLLFITMLVAVFGAHREAILGEGETALLYLLLFAAFFSAGPGRWSVDYWLGERGATA